MIALYLEGPIFRKSYVQMVFYLEGAMFGRSYVQKVLYSEDHCSEGLMLEHISIFQFQVHFTFVFYFLHNFIIHFFLGYTPMSSEDPTFSELQISKLPKFLENRTNPSSDVQKLRRHAYAFCAASFL